MREKDITPEVIKLSKEIAEIWRMEIYEGVWFISDLDLPILMTQDQLCDVVNKRPDSPIPSISDCLEKLRERHKFMPEYYNKKDFDRSLLNIFKNYIEGKFTVTEVHYWLLSALLGVLRDAESWDYRLFHPRHRDDKEK